MSILLFGMKAGENMATIRSAIQVTDGMSPAFKSMNKALNIVLNSFESLQEASGRSIDTSAIKAARTELGKAQMAVLQVEEQIDLARNSQEKFNGSVRAGQGAAGGLLSKFRGIAATAGVAFGSKRIIDLSDQMTSTTARLDLMNDGLQTTAELQKKIAQSAQRARTEYTDTAAAVSKLGILAKDAFSNNQEMIFFAEQMNKQFKIGGAGAQEQTAAMYQLTQAMASGRLQGDEFRSIMENAPMLAQSIAEYMGVSIGELREMSSQGLITADVIKNAMFNSAEETNKAFENLPMTFGQVGTMAKNALLQAFQPAIQVIGQGAQWIYEHWSTLEPVFLGLAVAVGIYAVATGAQAAATWLAVEANRALIATMLTNPALWVAMVIGFLIASVYKWVQSVGGAEIAMKIAKNGILSTWDELKIGGANLSHAMQTIWDGLGVVFHFAGMKILDYLGDLKTGAFLILQGLVNGSITLINDFIEKINRIPGVSIDAIEKVTFGTTAAMENEAAKEARRANFQQHLDDFSADKADRLSAIEQMRADADSAAAKRQAEIVAMQDAKAREAESNAFAFDDSQAYLAETAENTASMANSMDASEEELKYLRDLAEQEAINRFTTAEIKIDMGGITNHVASGTDLDGMMDYLVEKVQEGINEVAEGAHM